jgi:hypothetical protein
MQAFPTERAGLKAKVSKGGPTKFQKALVPRPSAIKVVSLNSLNRN